MYIDAIDLPRQATRLFEMQRAAYRVEAELIGDGRIPTLHETLEEMLAAPLQWRAAYETAVDNDPDVVVGAIAWTVDEVLDIDRLFVAPSAARRGAGRALVTAALDAAGPLAVIVSTGRDNLPALMLYESLGFVRDSDVEVLGGLWVTQLRRPPEARCPGDG